MSVTVPDSKLYKSDEFYPHSNSVPYHIIAVMIEALGVAFY